MNLEYFDIYKMSDAGKYVNLRHKSEFFVSRSINLRQKSTRTWNTIKKHEKKLFTYATVRGSGKYRSQAGDSCVTMTTRSDQERRSGPPGMGVTSQPRSIDPPELAPLFEQKVQGCQKSEVKELKKLRIHFYQSKIVKLCLWIGQFIF